MPVPKTNKSNIFPLWQPVGNSTHIIAKKLSEKLGVKTSHTGTLDPMAEGVIIVLAGKDRNKKYEFAEWLKEYEFNILFGVQTDTYDPLGLITFSEQKKIEETELTKILKKMVGPYAQTIPPYSAIKINGKPAHEHAREKTKVTLPKRTGEIKNIDLISLEEKSLLELTNNFKNTIKKIAGDFRQKDIISRWEKFEQTNQNARFQAAFIRVTLTKGLYVRTLSQDICSKLKTVGLAFNIVRTKNGGYTKENSLALEETFGNNYLKEYDFRPWPQATQ